LFLKAIDASIHDTFPNPFFDSTLLSKAISRSAASNTTPKGKELNVFFIMTCYLEGLSYSLIGR